MRLDLDDLKQLVRQQVALSPLADQLVDVDVEPGSDDEGSEFLRVFIRLQKHRDVRNLDELVALVDDIELAVSDRDDRHASVRFPDAA